MTLGVVDVGTVTNVVPTAYSGFAYPARKTKLQLLDDGNATTGNVVVQEGSKGYREATLTVVCETAADKDAVRAYEEESDAFAFVDDAGISRVVILLAFGADQLAGNLWSVTVTMLEISDPETAGS